MARTGTNHRGGRPSYTPSGAGPILSSADVAFIARVQQQTVSGWIKFGYKGHRLPPYDHSGGCVWLRATIVPWLETLGFDVPPEDTSDGDSEPVLAGQATLFVD